MSSLTNGNVHVYITLHLAMIVWDDLGHQLVVTQFTSSLNVPPISSHMRRGKGELIEEVAYCCARSSKVNPF